MSVVIVGPGTGEAIFVGVPSGDVLAVDSCMIEKKPACELVLPWLNARKVGCVLTHPHRDHAAGFGAAVTAAVASNGWIACADPNLDPDDDSTADALERYGKYATKSALSSIRQAWTNDTRLRRIPRRGDSFELGELRVEVLHPDEAFLARESELNLRSTVLMVEWQAARVLLGSDMEEEGWEDIALRCGVPTTRAIKIPHHCSVTGMHDCWLIGSDDRAFGCTPFSSHGLPRQEGVRRVLGSSSGVGVTALASGLTGQVTLADAFPPAPVGSSVFGRVQAVRVPGTRRAPWLYLAVDGAGNLIEERFGADSARVTA